MKRLFWLIFYTMSYLAAPKGDLHLQVLNFGGQIQVPDAGPGAY